LWPFQSFGPFPTQNTVFAQRPPEFDSFLKCFKVTWTEVIWVWLFLKWYEQSWGHFRLIFKMACSSIWRRGIDKLLCIWCNETEWVKNIIFFLDVNWYDSKIQVLDTVTNYWKYVYFQRNLIKVSIKINNISEKYSTHVTFNYPICIHISIISRAVWCFRPLINILGYWKMVL